MSAKRSSMPGPQTAITDEVIMSQVQRGSRVIDLGCGEGRLLRRLQSEQDCDVLGVELDMNEYVAAISQGVPVLLSDLNRGLIDIPTGRSISPSSVRRCSRCTGHVSCWTRCCGWPIAHWWSFPTSATGKSDCKWRCRGVRR